MASIPNDYPTSCSEDEIHRVISELHGEMANTGFNINTVLQISPLISLGQNELQKRMTNKNVEISGEIKKDIESLRKITDQATENSIRSEKSSRLLTYVSLIVAVSATLLSVFFAIQSEKSGKQWEEQEIKILEEQKDLMNKQLMFFQEMNDYKLASPSAEAK